MAMTPGNACSTAATSASASAGVDDHRLPRAPAIAIWLEDPSLDVAREWS
jgi:hypothetical protein